VRSRTLLSAALGIPLLVYAAIGAYSRYTADDFCWAGVLRTEGFVKAQVDWYTGYSPRYAFTFLVNVAELVGPAIVPLLPAAAIVAFLASLTWTFTQFGIVRIRAFVLAEIATLATLQTAPDLPQSLYWQTGMLTYLLPLILATFLISWIRRGNRAWWAVALCGLVTFVAGGLSEAYLIPQNVALTLALIVSVALRSGRTRQIGAALIGGVLALTVVLVAPATGSRVGGPPADLWLAASASIATAAVQAVRLGRFFPLTMLLCVAAPAVLSAWPCRLERRWLLLVTAFVIITLPFCYFPSFYAQNGNPPARSLIVPGAILIGYLLFLGTAIRINLAEAQRRLALAVLALIPIWIAIVTLPEVEVARSYAVLFDAEERQIRASRDAGQADLTVTALPANLGENFVSADRQNWFNVCVARYYGVRSIATSGS